MHETDNSITVSSGGNQLLRSFDGSMVKLLAIHSPAIIQPSIHSGSNVI